MSFIRRHSRLLVVAVSCAALGAGATAIASAGAATSSSSSPSGSQNVRARMGGLRRLMRAVQGSVVVRTRDGFQTVTFERGKVDSVSGQQLTLTEGTRKASYKTMTVTIPANAAVRDDGHRAALSDVKPGERVLVFNGPRRTRVIAHTPRAGG